MNGRELAEATALWVLRSFLAIIFAIAAFPKLTDPHAFADSVRSFQILADPWNARFAVFLPALELLIAIGILLPWLALGANALALFLFAGFVGALTSARARGLEVDCGCFGNQPITHDYYLEAISLRVVLFLMATAALWLGWRKAFGK